jgi:tetratricopeptide (TPR) repeat protein
VALCLLPGAAYSAQAFYTVQTGSFLSLEEALAHYESVVTVLSEKDLAFLRIEKVGYYFSVRLGKYTDRSEADRFHESVKLHFPSSLMRKAYIKDERIKKIYTGKSPVTKPVLIVKKKAEDSPLTPVQSDTSMSRVSEEIKETAVSASEHEKKGDIHLKAERFFKAAEEYKLAISKGSSDPVIYWKLSDVMYEMKFVDEATAALEKAVSLSPRNDVLRIELGKLYLVRDRLTDALDQLLAALRITPCYADLHYYLGEIFFRMKNYEMAWRAARSAAGLGHNSSELIRKLSIISKEPEEYPWSSDDDLYIRQILVDDYETAKDMLRRMSEGELFESIADRESKISSRPLGGYLGRYDPSELHPRISEKLIPQEIFAEPVIIETEKGVHIVQRVANFDFYFEENLKSD